MVIYIIINFHFFLYIDASTSINTYIETLMKGIDQDIAKKGT